MLPEHKQVLVVDDEANLRKVLVAQLSRDGYEVHSVEDGEAAREFLGEHHIDLVITDLRMPRVDGMELLRWALDDDPERPVVMITAHGTVDTAVEALKLGAFDYITKPFDKDELRRIVAKALKTRDLAGAEFALPVAPQTSGGPPGRFRIIGQSPQIQEVYAVIEKVADTPTSVLITGESGTGKELVARALHESSSRKDKPFIRLNCAAIPKDLMEAELFGYERGAFTGAVSSKPGKFELAHGGTLFLDEIGEIPVEMQVKLLRALQESEFERVGGIKTISVDVRLVTATNRDLKDMIGKGQFREDLFYRLNVVPIHLPALRERVSDIPLLVEHFLVKFNERLRKKIEGSTADSIAKLVSYPWPGNIRELENVIERAVLFCDDTRLGVRDLTPEVRGDGRVSATPIPGTVAATSSEPSGSTSTVEGGLREQVRAAMARLERDLIVRALQQTNSNVTRAARLLKISRKGLQLKMKELGLREQT
ncbi:MAG: sigma-54-dependent Fis family transcriptional regulator [Deltaproteobacteria bacterium]|nr:sigma-54-dependent Fis family transcriptional regulator [Deltaproteobacteria bacterium]